MYKIDLVFLLEEFGAIEFKPLLHDQIFFDKLHMSNVFFDRVN